MKTNMIVMPNRSNMTADLRLRNMLNAYLASKAEDIEKLASEKFTPGTEDWTNAVKELVAAETDNWRINVGLAQDSLATDQHPSDSSDKDGTV